MRNPEDAARWEIRSPDGPPLPAVAFDSDEKWYEEIDIWSETARKPKGAPRGRSETRQRKTIRRYADFDVWDLLNQVVHVQVRR